MQAGKEHGSAAMGAGIWGGEFQHRGRPWRRARMPSLVAAALVALAQPAVQAQQPSSVQAGQAGELAFSIAPQPLASQASLDGEFLPREGEMSVSSISSIDVLACCT